MDVVKQIFSLTPFTFLNHFSRIVLTIVLARLMSPEHYGSFAALLVLSEILLLPASLGFSSSLMRLAHPLYQNQRMDLLRGLQQVYMISIFSIGVVFVALVITGFAVLSPHQLANEHLYYLLLIVPLGALMLTQSSFLLVLNKKTLSIISQQSLFQFLTLAFCILIYTINTTLSLAHICQALVVSIALVVVYQYRLINPMIHNKGKGKAFNTKIWYQQSIALLASGAGAVLVAKLDVLLVHHLFGAHAVSIFFPAVVITGLVMILSNAVSTVLKPILLDKSTGAKYKLVITMRTFWYANSAIILALMMLAKPLLMLYGETQLNLGYEVLIIMLAAQFLLPLRVVASNLIKFTSNPLYNLYVLLFATTVTVLLALYLQEDYQLLGVATAFSIGFSLGALLRTAIVIIHLNTPLAMLFGFQSENRSHATNSTR